MHGLDLISGGVTISLENEGFIVRDIRIAMPEQKNEYQNIDGISGRYLMDSTHETTNIEVDVEYVGNFDLDFPLFRDKLTGLVSSTKPFYIREKRAKEQKVRFELPGERTGSMLTSGSAYANGKQYLVLRTGSSAFEQIGLTGSGTITFETAALPYAESIGTTMQLHNNGIRYEDGLWSYGMGLLDDTSTWVYRYVNMTSFNIYNAGDVTVDNPRMYRKIKITLSQSTSSFRLYDATGNYFVINKYLYSGDVITIDGYKVYVNGINQLTATNKYFPVILTGQNRFTVSGVTSFTIEFDFKFYYGGSDIGRLSSSPTYNPSVQDTTPPTAPSVSDVSTGTKTITGTSEEGATITGTFPNGAKATTVVSMNGSWGLNVPDGVTLATGQTVSFTATDRAGNVSGVTTTTVRGYPYSAPTVSKTTLILDNSTKQTEFFTISNLPLDKERAWVEHNSQSDMTINWSEFLIKGTSSYEERVTNTYDGEYIELYIAEPGTHQRLSPSAYVTVKAPTSSTTNLWRSSTKDYSSTLNSTGEQKITEIFSVVGNSSQQVDVKTSGDTVIVDGDAGAQRFYKLQGLKPNTKYILSYDITWTDTAPGIHTHAWGIGYLDNSARGTRKSFTFTTNGSGAYGYGNNATMDPPASSYLNAMNASAVNNIVTYSKITLNEGTVDLGYVAGTPTGV